MFNITFHGAARTTTGSMHIVQWNGKTVLLDCGLYQGHRKEAFERNRAHPVDPKSVSAVVLSHAHIDHSGNIPSLVRQGYRGPVYATPATRDLCDIMLRDSVFLQMRDVELVNRKRARQGKNLFEPLYEQEDVDRTMNLFSPLAYGETTEILPGLRLTLRDAGHILGSATCTLDYERGGRPRRFLFTGDLGQRNLPILRDPEPVPDVDVLVTESTYGDRVHPPKDNVSGRIKDYIEFIVQHRSKLVIPAFSVGRTQQILLLLNDLVESGRVPSIPVIVDSPLSRSATSAYANHRECFNERMLARLARGDDPFMFPGLRFTTSVDDSKTLNDAKGPMIIISASGMCEGGRVLHHLINTIQDPLNIVLIVGFQAEGTLGRRIVEHAEKVNILGEEYRLRASVYTINALSGHADSVGLRAFYKTLGGHVERAFCVHGEEPYCNANAAILTEEGVRKVVVPVQGQKFADL